MKTIDRISPRAAELGGGMMVYRALPTRQRRMVGPWCFLDHAGPVSFESGQGMHVGAHPHIGLQTFTWLIEGEVLHRDSLGNEQVIRPGQINLMTAGKGIVHTEDSLIDGQRLHAAQLWIALPESAADCAPAFEHLPNPPTWEHSGTRFTLLAGHYQDQTARGTFHLPLMGLDLHSMAGSALTLPLDPGFEYGLLVLEGQASLGGECFRSDEFGYLGAGESSLPLTLSAGSRVILLGGTPFETPVTMWWNFVGFDKAAIATARRQWETGDARFGPVGDGTAPRLIAPAIPWTER